MFHRRLKNINNFRIVVLGPRPMTPENLHFAKKTIDQWNFCCISELGACVGDCCLKRKQIICTQNDFQQDCSLDISNIIQQQQQQSLLLHLFLLLSLHI